MNTNLSGTDPANPPTADTVSSRRSPTGRFGADWAAVVAAAVLVVLAVLGLLPSIPFLVK